LQKLCHVDQKRYHSFRYNYGTVAAELLQKFVRSTSCDLTVLTEFFRTTFTAILNAYIVKIYEML